MPNSKRIALGGALALTLGLPALAEEQTLEAVSSWEARGQIYPTGTHEATFVGALSGILYVSGADGSMDAGLITCPSTLVIDTEDGSQIGRGKCVIVTPDAERVYGEFTCTGQFGKGCEGEFTLTGGTGEKAQISGGGPIQLRGALSGLALVQGNIVEQTTIGLAVWPKLTYKLP